MPQRGYFWWGLISLLGFLACTSSARAEDRVVGTYRCTSYQVDGRIGRCSSPPLILHADGCYRIWGEEGTYKVRGRWLVLSQAKKRGLGRLGPGRQISFDFTHQGKKHRVTFERQYEALPGSAFI
ncbi:MAG: hypothetical protein HY237_03125 [Acidobacteria bacterium]|nr:hypothetical protein [Acidobacteriota bacterium]